MNNDAISRSNAISRSAALSMMDEYIDLARDEELHHAMCVVAAGLAELPALDVAPVVHAHWIKTFGSDGFVSTLRCSKCGNSENSTYIPGNFCWFCGARMDGEEDEEN